MSNCRAGWSTFTSGAVLALVGGLTLFGKPVRADAPFLLGGGSPQREPVVELDPALPSGALRWVVPRPPVSERHCSSRRPVCVHVAPSLVTSKESSLAELALRSLERAYESLVLLGALPAPAGDEGRGGGDELDWYLGVGSGPSLGDGTPDSIRRELVAPGNFAVWLEALPSRGFDRASAFCMGGETDVERSAHLCVGEASLAARAPASAPHARRAYATHLWWEQGTLQPDDQLALRRLQEQPEAGVSGRDLDDRSEGAALWFAYLDAQVPGPSRGLALAATATLHLAATRTAPGALRWHAEPDVLDVLRHTLGDSRQRVARFWDGFAQSRMRLGQAAHSDNRWLGWASSESRAQAAWELTTSSLPRHLALPRPLQPTGSAYFVIAVDKPLDALALRATCEAPVSYVWSVARYTSERRLLSTLHVPFKEGQRVAEQRVMELDDVAYLVVSGTNLGGVDLAHPFDPDHEPFEPHGCSVYFAAL